MDDKLSRCLRLFQAFQQHGELATRDIMRVLDCDRQTATRDLRSLEDAGVPLDLVGDGRARRYRLDASYRRSGVSVTRGDAIALHFGRELLGFLDGTLVAEWHTDFQEKLAPSVPRATAEQEGSLAEHLIYLSEPYRPYTAHDDVLNTLLSCTLGRREVRLEYAGRTLRVFERVQPLALVVYRRALYTLAKVEGRTGLFRLAVDRVLSATRLEATFRKPPGFDPRAELDRTFGIADFGEPVGTVRLRFDDEVARYVRSRVWHSTQELVELPTGVELRMHCGGRELVRLALEFGEHVQVIEPAWLRDAVINELSAALRQYQPAADCCSESAQAPSLA